MVLALSLHSAALRQGRRYTEALDALQNRCEQFAPAPIDLAHNTTLAVPTPSPVHENLIAYQGFCMLRGGTGTTWRDRTDERYNRAMKRTEALSKLRSLEGAVDRRLSDEYDWRYLNPALAHGFFDQFNAVRDELRRQWPSLFDDLPVRPKPTPVDRVGGELYFNRLHVEVLRQDICQYAERLEANPGKQTLTERIATAALVLLGIALVVVWHLGYLPGTLAFGIALAFPTACMVGSFLSLVACIVVRKNKKWAMITIGMFLGLALVGVLGSSMQRAGKERKEQERVEAERKAEAEAAEKARIEAERASKKKELLQSLDSVVQRIDMVF